MIIAVHLDRARLFRWHLALVDALQERGHSVIVRFRDNAEPLPTSLTTILDFDRVRTHTGSERFSTHMCPEAFSTHERSGAHSPDLSIDISVSSRVKHIDGRVLRPFYNGESKDYVLFHTLLEGRAPHLSALDTNGMRTWDIGLPAIETPTRLAPSLDQVASRLVEGLIKIVAGIAAGELAPVPHESSTTDLSAQSILQAAGTFASARTRRKAANVRDRLTGNSPRWHVAWRQVAGDSVMPGHLNLSDFRILAEDGKRFYADPFIFIHDGTRHVFIEELPDATGTGIISHFIISKDGEASQPKPVLTRPFHLSYPFVFAHGGEIWMMPEQSASGGLDLYRAAPFPGTWVQETRLIVGALHDATLFEHDGLFWIAAGMQALQSSSWDGLSLYWSRALKGPWTAHTRNPVLIDARSARPAGPLWRDDKGQLIRPAQDCSTVYGGRMTLKAITELTPERFREEEIGQIQFGFGQQLFGPHTIGRAGGIEVVDIYARPGAIRAGYRNPTTL